MSAPGRCGAFVPGLGWCEHKVHLGEHLFVGEPLGRPPVPAFQPAGGGWFFMPAGLWTALTATRHA